MHVASATESRNDGNPKLEAQGRVGNCASLATVHVERTGAEYVAGRGKQYEKYVGNPTIVIWLASDIARGSQRLVQLATIFTYTCIS